MLPEDKKRKLGGITSIDFQDKLFLIQFFDKVHQDWKLNGFKAGS